MLLSLLVTVTKLISKVFFSNGPDCNRVYGVRLDNCWCGSVIGVFLEVVDSSQK